MTEPDTPPLYQLLLNRTVLYYSRLLLAVWTAIPLALIFYIEAEQDPHRLYQDHPFHIIAITLAILLSGFISYVSWRSYQASGEPMLRWITLGFLGFSIIYAPHGFLTHMEDSNPWLFLLYGPASRLAMALCFFIALWKSHHPADTQSERKGGWFAALSVFLLIDLLVALLAYSNWRADLWLRLSMEGSSIALYTLSALWVLFSRRHNSLMLIYAVAMLWFAQSSVSFILGLPWNHQWWLAHLVFAGGFLLLSYGVVQVFLTTGSFSKIYTQTELLAQVLREKSQAESVMQELQKANAQLEHLASTDPLTGAANRREFMQRAEQEIARVLRNHNPLCLLSMDLDHFKKVNDEHGHQMGDEVLKSVIQVCEHVLRPGDSLGRIGGEEFAILLPETEFSEAFSVAERLRSAIEHHQTQSNGITVKCTASIGIAAFDPQQDLLKDLIKKADDQLYLAKNNGRNRVEPQASISHRQSFDA
jgi:diguanylate cyclase (GGDEF)-like protein